MNTHTITKILSILHLGGDFLLAGLTVICWNLYQQNPALVPYGNFQWVIVLFVVFVIAYLACAYGIFEPHLLTGTPVFKYYIVIAQYGSYLGLLFFYQHPLLFFLPIMTSISLAMSLKKPWKGVVIVIVLNIFATSIALSQWNDPMLVMHSIGSIGLQLVFLFFFRSLIQHYEVHLKLQDKIRNLETTRDLLSKVSAQNERLKVSRDLHDIIGHQLTGLQLNLEIAEHISSGKALKHLSKARTISKDLLESIRKTVSNLRAERNIDLEQSLNLLVKNISFPIISIDVNLQGELSSKQAEVLLRCSQEAITNILKHSKAKRASIQLSKNNDCIELIISDNGKGMSNNSMRGNGLTGMEERLSEIGGKFTIQSEAKTGTQIQVTLP